MSFKIWGREGTFNQSELQENLLQLGVTNTFSLIQDIMRKGSASVGRTKVFLLK
jgi:hypothetical protein